MKSDTTNEEKPNLEWRWVDQDGHAMTQWSANKPPPVLDLTDSKGTMHVEVRIAGVPESSANTLENAPPLFGGLKPSSDVKAD